MLSLSTLSTIPVFLVDLSIDRKFPQCTRVQNDYRYGAGGSGIHHT